MLDPQTVLDIVVAQLDAIVLAWRAPAALLLGGIVAFRPKHESCCVMIGRTLLCVACVFWIVAGVVPSLDRAARIGDVVMFLSAFASHVCEVFMNWRTTLEAKRREAPSQLVRVLSAARAPRRPISTSR